MKMTILALALTLCAAQARASLGENETQLIKHYGKELGSFIDSTGKYSTAEFEYGIYHVSVTLLDGQSGREVFSRIDKKPLNTAEMQTLLDANALGSKWKKMHENESLIIWVLDSKEGFAAYYTDADKATNKDYNSLVIKTRDMLAFEEALMRMQQQDLPKYHATPTPVPVDPKLRP